MKKVVQYIPALVNGGIEAMLLNYYERLNKKFKFIIIVHGEIEQNCKNKFEELGAKIYKIPHWNDNFFKHNSELYRILKNEKPHIFHSHHGIYNFIPCLVALYAGIKIRISHCHAYFPKKSSKEKLFSCLTYFFATNHAACGKGAAKYLVNAKKMQNGDVEIIYNAIDLEKFKYNRLSRKKIRNSLNWNDNLIYGNVGRFCLQKNQLFLIEIYERIFELNKKARFLIIGGNGNEYDKIVNKLNNSPIKDYCILLNNIQNVNEYYLAMDFLILPSLFEGFAVSVVESQVSNLPCILSPTITREFETNNIYYSKSLENIDDWINSLNEVKQYDRSKNLVDFSNFDINKSCKNLESYYNSLIEEG